ncbi:rhodanese-related sulfurtransferase [Catenovulum agarivorans DS-2]|uniref:Rhodanese-related sulfurtransferase n=1 Tax=Catenovulum agarivorans DS-2 TaxID=1328313 RepID=W7R3H1_9ALTE|nr:rhodanese-like domain-containing protein [Catenovulum agarivorans]EWH12170.1 rhodanese-related sulfurtransferase [Catenovulum agarivorans DS-2]
MSHSPEFLALVNDARSRIKEIDIETYLQMVASNQQLLLVDVREQDEWQKDHLPNAVYLGRGVIERDIETLYPNKDLKLVLYCGGGYRSALAADSLSKMGYKNVINLDGGYRRWCSLNLPLES